MDEQEKLDEIVSTATIPNTVLEGLVRENHTLKTWVAGLIAGCEGCKADAEAWAGAIALVHHAPGEEVESPPST